ncbi:DsbA family protein [Brevibacterium sp. RIT 803]|uniref:DsbA family oxidoreductase n=1 Tax=Brevibacterium sp. RIT 803 TaxID=2810210 RepID=UPI00194EFE18|nr:DsbA family protein [Brevibacterium sp. RIT 803]MBM6591536.1 DsbA family protein [Brevibacterium sp. RIT 803]
MTDVQIWADVRCPWCWIGHRRLERAAREIGVDLVLSHRSFLLEPEGPPIHGQLLPEVATSEWGMKSDEWASLSQRIREAGQDVGLDISIDTALRTDSRAVHRVLRSAQERGLDVDGAWERAFEAHLRGNLDVSDPDVLQQLGIDMGLNATEVHAAIASDHLAAMVRDDHREAVDRRFPSVPAFLIGDHSISGAASVEELTSFLQKASGPQ